jgi:hypothetical protein
MTKPNRDALRFKAIYTRSKAIRHPDCTNVLTVVCYTNTDLPAGFDPKIWDRVSDPYGHLVGNAFLGMVHENGVRYSMYGIL